jgi:serine/threonine protein kinase
MSVSQPVVAKPPAPRIGDYEILSIIGRGGIAEIYKALQPSLQREVAIKVLSPQYTSDSEIVKRFEQEALLIARLNHPNIVHVIDKGVQGGRYYFVMEFVDGADFKATINDPKIDLPAKIEMLMQVCKALDFAHQNGVVHRDIKPANILVDRQGNAKLADFGIAQLRGNAGVEITSSDVVMGTVAYMSPEQKYSAAQVTRTADIYALGVILYEICCGKRPEVGCRPPSELNPAVPKAMDGIINRCLAEHPGDRFPSVDALKEALLALLSGGSRRGDGTDTTLARVESFIGKCRPLDTLREDRFGATYLVENREARKLFVIRKSRHRDAGLKEARMLTSLRHKNIITILGAGGDITKTVVVTEYAPGGSLTDRLTRLYPWKEALGITVQVAEALRFAHTNNIIHGNLRPSNVLFDQDDVVKVTDFGLPPHVASNNPYLPPEKKPSRQGDMYALGVILFTLLTGHPPAHKDDGAPQVSELERKLPKTITTIITRLAHTQPTGRYRSLDEMLAEYNEFIQSLAEPAPTLTATESGPKAKKRPWLSRLFG